jgi:hypothetical protein
MDLNDEKPSRIFSPAEAMSKSSKKTRDYYYDAIKKEYLVQNARGGWIALNETQFKRILKKEGYSARVSNGGRISPLDELLIHLQRHKDVYYVGPLAGHPAGFYEVGETRILVTVSPKVIEPVKGEWPVLHQFLSNLFHDDDHDQLPYVYGWIKVAYEALRNGKRRPGQALVLAGPHNCGKSLFQNLLTLILGGRTAKPYQYMMGITSFNADLFEAEHLAMEDEHASTDIRTRRHFGSQIKNVTVNDSQRCHGKHQKGTVLYPFWRLSVSLNDEPENLMVLPPIDDSLEDKLMLLRAVRLPMPMPTGTQEERGAFWNKLLTELPALLDFLLSWDFPSHLSCQRFGIKHFHHPDLLAAIDTLAPEYRLLNLIDGELFQAYGSDVWNGSAEELERELCCEGSKCRMEARKLLYFNTACGVYLGRLLKRYPDRVERHRDSANRTWTIHKGKA